MISAIIDSPGNRSSMIALGHDLRVSRQLCVPDDVIRSKTRPYGYCADFATRSVSTRNFETAACAAVSDSAVVGDFAIDGSSLPSAVA
jgi:hypothetical protein